MKNFIKTIPTATVVFLVLAVISFIWGADQYRISQENDSITIVDIDDSSRLSDCEGETVCTSGKPTVVKKPTDALTGVSADGYVLVRTVEMYQYTINDDMVCKSFLEYQNDNIEGKNGELYTNPAFPDNIKNAVFFADAKLENTGIRIDESYLNAVYNKESMTSENITCETLDNITVKGFSACGDGYYTSADPQNPQIGDIRIAYKYIPADSIDNITICGMMKNGSITPENASVSCVSDSVKTAEDILLTTKGDYGSAAKGFLLFGVIEIVIAAIVFIIKKRKTAEK